MFQGSHCVVALRITKWNDVECLELENSGGSRKDSRYIPVDFPFFEEVYNEVKRRGNLGSPNNKIELNKYGKGFCKMKYGTIESDWYKQKAKKGSEETGDKYQLMFLHVNAKVPCYQLEFKC